MGSIKTKIEIDIITSTPFELKPKTDALVQLSTLDLDVLLKLAELSKSQNAITQLKTNFPMIKGFLS